MCTQGYWSNCIPLLFKVCGTIKNSPRPKAVSMARSDLILPCHPSCHPQDHGYHSDFDPGGWKRQTHINSGYGHFKGTACWCCTLKHKHVPTVVCGYRVPGSPGVHLLRRYYLPLRTKTHSMMIPKVPLIHRQIKGPRTAYALLASSLPTESYYPIPQSFSKPISFSLFFLP